ncbi:Mismatch repair protein msh3 [Coemansia sp. RSA 988]|nr:Mismatch repair protein msh3 [Coemansia sp. RSA 988]
MGQTKRVQASLSSFFKRSTQEKSDSSSQTPEQKRRRTDASGSSRSDSETETEQRTGLHAGTGGQGQSSGHTTVRAVADAEGLKERVRRRAREGAVAGSAVSAGVGTGRLEETEEQLVRRRAGERYTPLEEQVLAAKQQHADTVLAVEVGYKFRFFGEDARIAARVLGIMCTRANNFYNASIPAPRLMVHVRRLVHAGFKVGVMRQTETAALKAASEGRGAPFGRQVAEIFTAGTLVEDVDEPGGERVVASIAEVAGDGREGRTTLGIVAVQPGTGDVVYDEFEDGILRGALDTRLAHVRPAELVVAPGLTTETERVLAAYTGCALDASAGCEPRLEHAERSGVRVEFGTAQSVEEARRAAAEFYGAQAACVATLPDTAAVALAQLVEYLRAFGLERALLPTADGASPLVPFHTRMHMLLPATALQTLGVFTAATSGDADSRLDALLLPGARAGGVHSTHMPGGDGSLFSTMDFTHSQFGRRMLRRWVAHPLVTADLLSDRTDAVAFLRDAADPALGRLRTGLSQLVDLERGLCRIRYAQATPPELLRILRSLAAAMALVPPDLHIADCPRLVAELLSADVWTTELRDSVHTWREQLDADSAKATRTETLFARGPLADELRAHQNRVEAVDAELQSHIEEVRTQLGDASLEFRSVAGSDYLVDLRHSRAKHVPPDWVRVSATKTHARFHTPFAVARLAERERRREALLLAARDAYRRFLALITACYAGLRRMVTSLATLDALFSLAILAQQPGFCRPDIVDAPAAFVDLCDAVHPVLRGASYVPNSVRLGFPDFQDTPTAEVNSTARAMILTGPNAGGKSSLIRTVALIAIMAQCGSYVPARRARLAIVDAVFTRIGASDKLMAAQSTFMVEMRETADILRHVSPRSLVVIDELGRGTSTHDGAAIAFAVLAHLLHCRPLVFFVTHYAHLADAFAANSLVRSCHMSFVELASASANSEYSSVGAIPELAFLYKLANGASSDSFGLNVARIAGLPDSLLRCAKERAVCMRSDLDSRWAARCAVLLRNSVAQAKRGFPISET